MAAIQRTNRACSQRRSGLQAPLYWLALKLNGVAASSFAGYLTQGSIRPVIGKDPYLIATATICLPLSVSMLRVQYSPNR